MGDKRLRAVVGITLADGTRIEAGKLVPKDTTIPDWLIEQGKVK